MPKIDRNLAGFDAMERILANNDLESQLDQVGQLEPILAAIKHVQSNQLTINNRKSILDLVKSELPTKFKVKLNNSLLKNPDYDNVFLLEGVDKEKFLYAPLTSVDVERSFSIMEYVFDDRRGKLTTQQLNKISIVYCSLQDK